VQETFPRLLLEHAQRRPDAAAMRVKEYGIWQTLSWGQLADTVRRLSFGLAAAGVGPGQHVVVLGENRPRLYAVMLATQALGAVPVPLYQDAAASELVHPINMADVAFVVAQNQEQVDKLLEIRDECASVQRIWFDDPKGLRNYSDEGLASIDQLLVSGEALERVDPQMFVREVASRCSDEAAAMFFTSGTTGKPKGVVHTHATLLDRAKAGAEFDRLTHREEVLAYLPPAWIGQNIFSFAQWLACGYVVNCPEAPSTVRIDLKEVGPTYYFAPPPVFEGVLTDVTIRMADAGAVQRWLFQRFMSLARRVGPARMAGQRVGWVDRLLYAVGDIVTYGPLRNNLGLSRVRVAYTAGEAIGPDLFTFYRSIGVNLKQLYGSTETAVFVCQQPDHEVRADTVGVPTPGVELKVGDDGEIFIRSPGLLKEYYKNPAATAEVKTTDGWYRSGDAGYLDASGHLKIIDRIKDVGRLRGGAHDGAMFPPKYIENKLKFFPYIKEAVAFGDGRSHVCAFINIDPGALGNWAERRNLPYSGYADLAGKNEVLDLIGECLQQVNAELAGDEKLAGLQIHRFIVLHKELDADDGEMTRSRKVRRGFVADKYGVLVDAMYSGEATRFFTSEVQFEDGRKGQVSAHLLIRDVKTFPTVRRAA
jgi:long-chain acyl-CoA synthetase